MREGAGMRSGGQTAVPRSVTAGGWSRASMKDVYSPAGAEQSIKISRDSGEVGFSSSGSSPSERLEALRREKTLRY